MILKNHNLIDVLRKYKIIGGTSVFADPIFLKSCKSGLSFVI